MYLLKCDPRVLFLKMHFLTNKWEYINEVPTKTGLLTLYEALFESELALEQIQYYLVKCRFRGSITKIKLSKQTFESLNLFNRTVVTRCYLNFVNYSVTVFWLTAFWEWVLFKNHFLWPSTIRNVLIALQAILTSFLVTNGFFWNFQKGKREEK